MPRVFRCPACGATIGLTKGTVFRCPVCREELCAQFPFSRTVFCAGVVLSPLLSYAIGLRGLALLLVSLVAWLPIGMVFRVLLNQILPPKIVRNTDVKRPPSVREVIREHREPLGLNLDDKKHP